jgi:ADP-ribose pyrophosphatase YjhB (NUDIX family)
MEKNKEYPLTTVGALIFNQEKKILLVKTHKWKGKYGLPGGKIDLGETAIMALHRELKEEVNLSIQNINFLLLQEVIFSEEFYKPKHFIFLNYTCETVGNEEVILNEEAQEFLWIFPKEALDLPLNTPTKLLIEMYLEALFKV